ncbi:unnamed protein product [Rotaria magnacalcarata]|uniref:Uncharacterized protein n=1 Tax=Rotaria magnacalcarata TaxID=392030 RepID=A0A816ZGW1_9BILA|nr:unnamed protein product [Rotaria magnacalcarata]
MSRSLTQRNTALKALPPVQKVSGPNLMFKWSVAGAHSYFLEDHFSIALPSIDNHRSSQLTLTNPSPLIGLSQPIHSSISTRKASYLSSFNKKYSSPRHTEDGRSSRRSSPLSLSYEQLYQLHQMPPLPVNLMKQNSFMLQPLTDNKCNNISLQSIYDDKLNNASTHSMSDYKEKMVTFHPINIEKQKNVSSHPISDKRRSSISSGASKISSNSKVTVLSTATAPIIATRPAFRLSNTELVRLNTPQLRRMNVSEKYMAEAKKLYFNAYCKSFVPRVVI